MSFTFFAASLLTAASASASAPCAPIAGWEPMLTGEQVRWVIVGEMHGNNESPDIFADAVCLTARSREKVVVGIEQPAHEQAAIDRFLASDGGEAAQRQFLQRPMWNGPMQDGRASQANFRLFETLRQFKAAGRIDSVVAFVPTGFSEPPSPAEYEKAMADLLQAAASPGATVIALVGNVHTMREEVSWGSTYMPMAGHLPPESTITLNAVGQGGESWNCQRQECGAHPISRPPQLRPRGIELIADGAGPYSGLLHLGTATTASPPQQAVPTRSD